MNKGMHDSSIIQFDFFVDIFFSCHTDDTKWTKTVWKKRFINSSENEHEINEYIN